MTNVQKRKNLLRSFGGLCALCGHWIDPRSVTIDHVPPKSYAKKHPGMTMQEVPTHEFCNQAKGSMPLVYVARLLEQIERRVGTERFIVIVNPPLRDKEDF